MLRSPTEIAALRRSSSLAFESLAAAFRHAGSHELVGSVCFSLSTDTNELQSLCAAEPTNLDL